MQLVKPKPYQMDPGRSLHDGELEQAAREATPLDKIRVRTCKLLGKGDRHRGTIGD